MTVTPPCFLERQSCTRATDTAPMLGDPGADSRGGTKILRGKSERVKVYKTSDKTSGLLLLSDRFQSGWLFLRLIGQKNIVLANQRRASSAPLSCLLARVLLSPSIDVLVLSAKRRFV